MSLKPSPPTLDGLIGGFDVSDHWYEEYEENNKYCEGDNHEVIQRVRCRGTG